MKHFKLEILYFIVLAVVCAWSVYCIYDAQDKMKTAPCSEFADYPTWRTPARCMKEFNK